MSDLKIGLALSGGGYRATVFHLGALARMAEADLLDQVTMISTVSGGSLAVGLIYGSAGYAWPGRETYIGTCLPAAFGHITRKDLQLNVILETLLSPLSILTSRAGMVSRNIRRSWGLDVPLNALPQEPRWIINTTCYESGRNFRFETFAPSFQAARMGSSGLGYVHNPAVPLSDALAASAGFPVAIGPLAIETGRFEWRDYLPDSRWEHRPVDPPPYAKLHLWDGGVYDNLGLEALVNSDIGAGKSAYRTGINSLFVSNASGRMKDRAYKAGFQAVDRLISIPKYQIEALRSRDTIHRYRDHGGDGRYFKTGNSCRKILDDGGKPPEEIEAICGRYLDQDTVDRAADFSTTLRRLERDEFLLLFRHGYEVADCTMHVFGRQEFALSGYNAAYWEGEVFHR